MEFTVPTELRPVFEKRVDLDVERWWTRNMKASFPWLSAEKVWLVVGRARGSLVFGRRADGSTVVYDTAEGRRELSDDLRAQFGSDPVAAMSIDKFLRAMIILLDDPRQKICTQEWFRRIQPTLANWLRGREKDPSTLERHCSSPAVEKGVNGWSIAFTTLNHDGSLARRTVSGRLEPFSVDDFRTSPLMAPGSFSNPEEF